MSALDPAQRLALARLLTAVTAAPTPGPAASGARAAPPAGATLARRGAEETAVDQCVNAVNLFASTAAAVEEAAPAAFHEGPTGGIVRAWAAAKYLAAYVWAGQTSLACTIPGTYRVKASQLTDEGTRFTIEATRRSFTRTDAQTNALVESFYATWDALGDAYPRLVAALPSRVSAVLRRLPTDVGPTARVDTTEVDPATVSGDAASLRVAGPGGAVELALTSRPSDLLLTPLGSIDHTIAEIGLRIDLPPQFADRLVRLPVPVQRCFEQGTAYRACSHRVTIATTPLMAGVPTLELGVPVRLTATVYDAQDNVLTGRTVTWSTAAGDVLSLSTTAGPVTTLTGLRPTEIASVTARAGHPLFGPGADLFVEVIEADSLDFYRTLVAGTWTVRFYDLCGIDGQSAGGYYGETPWALRSGGGGVRGTSTNVGCPGNVPSTSECPPSEPSCQVAWTVSRLSAGGYELRATSGGLTWSGRLSYPLQPIRMYLMYLGNGVSYIVAEK